MVHQYKLNGYNIVLDTCSGSVHAVDEVAYDIIAMYQAHSAEEIVERIMATYGDRPDVTREEVLTLCVLRGGTGASAPDATLTKELTAAGCDLYTLLSATEIPEGLVGLIYARSGLASKKGLAPANKVGVIDNETDNHDCEKCN